MSTINRRGRWTLIAGLALGLLGPATFPQTAHADEIVRTNGDASLRARPGERAPTVAKLSEGQSMRVLGRQGRWLKVSVKGKVGWVTRTQVDGGETVSARTPKGKKRTSPAKARKKGFNSLDDKAVGADAVEEADVDEDAPAAEEETADAADQDQEEVASSDDDDGEVKKSKKSDKGTKAKAAVDSKKAKLLAKKKKSAGKVMAGSAVIVTAGSTVHEKPSKKSEEKWNAEEGAQLKVLKLTDDGDWAKIEDGEGEKGWIASRDLMVDSGDEESDDSGEAVASDDSSGGGGEASSSDESDGASRVSRKASVGPSKNAIRVYADVGVLSRSQAYTSPSKEITGNYNLANTSPAVILGGAYMRDLGRFQLGVEGGGYITAGGSGIQVGATGGAQAETLSWTALQIDARGVAGYKLSTSSGMGVYGRVGYHIESTTVGVSKTAKLPSENLSGVTVGAAFEAPRLTSKIGARLGVDYLVGGTLLQTENLKDGAQSAVVALYVTAMGSYCITPRLSANLGYQLSSEGYAFSGDNQRDVTAKNAKRSDLQHVVGIGVGYQF